MTQTQRRNFNNSGFIHQTIKLFTSAGMKLLVVLWASVSSNELENSGLVKNINGDID